MVKTIFHRIGRVVTRSFLVLTITATFILLGILLSFLVPLFLSFPIAVLSGLILGLLVADVITGFIHWFGDTWGKPTWPVLGGFINDFRVHHIEPHKICEHDFLYVCASSFLFAPYFMYWGVYLLRANPTWSSVFWGCFLGVMTIMGALTNLFHKWAHEKPAKVPKLVRWLQRSGLILAPDHHQQHHTYPHVSHYNITNGWMNAALERLRFFRALEWIGKKVFKAEPRSS